MPWGKVDDELHAHEKVAQAGLEAMGLWVVCLSWARYRRTRGFVPRAIALKKCDASARRLDALTKRLVDARLWEAVEGGWLFHDWADYQIDDEALSEIRTAAGRKGAEATNSRKAAKPLPTDPASAAAKTRQGDPPPLPPPNPGEEIPHVAPPPGRDPFVNGGVGSEWCSAIRAVRGTGVTRLHHGEVQKLIAAADEHQGDAPDRLVWIREAATAFAQAEGGRLTVSVWAFARWLDNARKTRSKPNAVPVQAAPPAERSGWTIRGPRHARPETTGTPGSADPLDPGRADAPKLREVR